MIICFSYSLLIFSSLFSGIFPPFRTFLLLGGLQSLSSNHYSDLLCVILARYSLSLSKYPLRFSSPRRPRSIQQIQMALHCYLSKETRTRKHNFLGTESWHIRATHTYSHTRFLSLSLFSLSLSLSLFLSLSLLSLLSFLFF